MAHCAEPYCLLLGTPLNDLEDLVRRKCSVWQLLSRRIDDIASS